MKYNYLPFLPVTGIVCPLFSLRTGDDFGVGDIGSAYSFIDFLSENHLTAWKVLPLLETSELTEYNPYAPRSAYAFSTIHIDMLSVPDLPPHTRVLLQEMIPAYTAKSYVDFKHIEALKERVFHECFESFYENEYLFHTARAKELQDYINSEYLWLPDYALFQVLHEIFQAPLQRWPLAIRRREKHLLRAYKERYKKEILYQEYLQWIVKTQWQALRKYAQSKRVSLLGDVPFYISPDSADVWVHPDLFKVSDDLTPLCFGGTPPDVYAKQGQVWENAVYDWEALARTTYAWWYERILHHASHMDGLRLDHFRGFIQYWEVETDKPAVCGKWIDGPGFDFLNDMFVMLEKKLRCRIWVEDLGLITPDVEKIRTMLGVEGYHVFIFEWERILKNDVQYHANMQTTVHDTAPLCAWWKTISAEQKMKIAESFEYPLVSTDLSRLSDELRWKIIYKIARMPFSMKLFPVQDILGLETRINDPRDSDREGNWNFRLPYTLSQIRQDAVIQKRLLALISPGDAQTVISIPGFRQGMQRQYRIGEDVTFYVLSKKSSGCRIETDMPVIDNKRLIFSKVAVNEYGILYTLTFRPAYAGIYVLTLMNNVHEVGTMTVKIRV